MKDSYPVTTSVWWLLHHHLFSLRSSSLHTPVPAVELPGQLHIFVKQPLAVCIYYTHLDASCEISCVALDSLFALQHHGQRTFPNVDHNNHKKRADIKVTSTKLPVLFQCLHVISVVPQEPVTFVWIYIIHSAGGIFRRGIRFVLLPREILYSKLDGKDYVGNIKILSITLYNNNKNSWEPVWTRLCWRLYRYWLRL